MEGTATPQTQALGSTQWFATLESLVVSLVASSILVASLIMADTTSGDGALVGLVHLRSLCHIPILGAATA